MTQNGEEGDLTARDEIRSELLIEINVLDDDIADFIGEICFDATPASDVLARLETFRTTFRSKHYKLRHYSGETYDEKYSAGYDETIEKIRQAIKETKTMLSGEKSQQKIRNNHQEEAMLFQSTNVSRCFDKMKLLWNRSAKDATDDHLIQWKESKGNSII